MQRSLFDSLCNGLARIDMYRHWVTADYAPHEREALVWNWHPEDQEAYCGGEYARHR